MLPTPTRYALIKGCHAFPIAACERLVIPAWRTSAAVCFLQFPRLLSTKCGLLRAPSALGLELGSPERAEPREPNPDTHVLARSRRPRTGRPSSNDYRI